VSLLPVVDSLHLPEPTRTHATALCQRASNSDAHPSFEPAEIWAVGLEYLARRVDDLSVQCESVACRRNVEPSDVLRILPAIRSACAYRAYVGEWIRADRTLAAVSSPTSLSSERVAPNDRVAGHVAHAVSPSTASGVAEIADTNRTLPGRGARSLIRLARQFLFPGRSDSVADSQEALRKEPAKAEETRRHASETKYRDSHSDYSSWTGTLGSKSYYNKDQSPD
jgi:hypothetical protein